MNKRIKKKHQQQQLHAAQEIRNSAPLSTRVRDDLAQAVDAVVNDVKSEIQAAAPELEQKAIALAKKLPDAVSDKAVAKIEKLGKKVGELTSPRAPQP